MSKKDILGKVLIAVVVVAVVSLLMMCAYTMGRETGRTETVKMVDDLASQYTFMIKDEDDWQLGASKGGDFFPDYTASLEHEYDWDDMRIHLWYNEK